MLIKNGLIVFEDGARNGDIRVGGEIILEVGESLLPHEGEQVIDASGMIVLPGGVDVHTHMDLKVGDVRASDDFYTGTVAAAFGGTTTIVDHMAFGPAGCLISQRVDEYHRLAEGKAVIDYGFHGVVSRVDDTILDDVRKLAGEGITSHKFYLTYDGKISDYEVVRLMERSRELGLMLAVHAENDGMITRLRERFLAGGKTSTIYHALSRPPESEAEAVGRVAMLASMAGDAPIYFVHISAGLSLEIIRAARARGQKNLFAETCPQYLFLDESMYLREVGLKYVMSPPLRTLRDQGILWGGVLGGDFDAVGTDHCPFFYGREKQLGKDNFTKTPGGMPGVEARMPLMLSRALGGAFCTAAAGRHTLERLVSICCANPARLFGLYPKKGVIAVGSDADLVLVDPTVRKALTFDMLHENTDYTPYEGLPLFGYPVLTISRGEVIVKDGSFVGSKGRGKFLKRGLPDLNVRNDK